MTLEELRDRLWQCNYSEDREAFDLWVKENIKSLLRKCIELSEAERYSGEQEGKISNLEDEISSLEGEIEDLENTIDKLENQNGAG